MRRTQSRIESLSSLTIALCAATALPAETVQSYDGYRSWLVACDNGLRCIAKGFGEDGDGAEIQIERDAGGNGAITASIRATHPFALPDIRIDGKPAGLSSAAWQIVTSEGETSATSDDLPAIRALVHALRDATKVTLTGDDAIPLDGFAAAMLRIDERQGRWNGTTALIRPGPIPASRVPAPPSLPKIPNHPIRAQLAPGEGARLIAAIRTDRKDEFDKEECEEMPPAPPEAYALDKDRALVLIPCILGAYQGSSLAFLAPRKGGRAQRLIAPTPYLGNDPDRSDNANFTESVFDPETGTLSTAAKGRGMADCGKSASWIWDGTRFQLSAMTLQQACGGVEPGDWPVIFRSRR